MGHRTTITIATVSLVGLIGMSALTWKLTAGADVDTLGAAPLNPASITAVRNHDLTPGPIATESKLASRGKCPASLISYHSDGFKEYALSVRPTGKAPAAGFPVAIIAHGYTDPRSYKTDNTQYASLVEYYCSHNYLVLKPDYRGHGLSEGKPDNGLYSPVDTYDVLNLAASLPGYPGADSHRVALIGHSMGGSVVLRAGVASHNQPIKAIVTLAGAVASLDDMTYRWTGKVPPDVLSKRAQVIRAEGPPSQNPGYWQDGSPINYVADLAAPVQIHQGLADTSVPATFAVDLNLALSTSGITHEYYTYPGTGHLFSDPSSMGLFLIRSLAFMNKYDK